MSITNPIDQLKQDLHALDYFDALVQQYLLNTVGVATDKYGVPATVTDIHYDGGTYAELNASFCWLGTDFILHIIRDEESFKVTVEAGDHEIDIVHTGRLAEEIRGFFFDFDCEINEAIPDFTWTSIPEVRGDTVVYTGEYRGMETEISIDPDARTWYASIGDGLLTDPCEIGSSHIRKQADRIVDETVRQANRSTGSRLSRGCSPTTGKTYVNDIRHLLEPANVVFVLEDTEFDPECQSLTYHGTIDGVGATFTIVENIPMEVSVTFFTDDGGIVGAERVTGKSRREHTDAIPALVSRTMAANESIAARKSARIKDLPEETRQLSLEERIARLERLHNIE